MSEKVFVFSAAVFEYLRVVGCAALGNARSVDMWEWKLDEFV
jgi:hypothetical protein